MSSRQTFALIPAAGQSSRMGKPKLILPWKGKSIIEHLIDSLGHSEIKSIVVVVRPNDEQLTDHLKNLSVTVVRLESPTDEMKLSVQKGLQYLQEQFSPSKEDCWLLCPADYPLISPETVRTLVQQKDESDADIITPLYQSRRGHPVLFRWKMAEEVFQLPSDQGINSIVHDPKFSSLEVTVDDPGIITDIDTPGDYEKLQDG